MPFFPYKHVAPKRGIIMTEIHEAAIRKDIEEAIFKGDLDEVVRLRMLLPLPPHIAKNAREAFGTEYIKNAGFDLSLAEKEYGKDWLNQ